MTMRSGLAITALLIMSVLSLRAAHAEAVKIDGATDAAVKQAMEKFYKSVFNSDVTKKVSVDLLIGNNGLKLMTIDGKPAQAVCDDSKRLDDARSIKVEFQDNSNVLHQLEFALQPNDTVRAWTDVACIYGGSPDPTLRIRGTFVAKGMSPRVQMYNLQLVSIAP
jgi:hypothetical protein